MNIFIYTYAVNLEDFGVVGKLRKRTTRLSRSHKINVSGEGGKVVSYLHQRLCLEIDKLRIFDHVQSPISGEWHAIDTLLLCQ